MEMKHQALRVQKTLNMRLRGPIDSEDADSLIESRIAHLETENVLEKGKGYFKESEFPDYQNSLHNANSTFFEQR